jgi:hypothetical protein
MILIMYDISVNTCMYSTNRAIFLFLLFWVGFEYDILDFCLCNNLIRMTELYNQYSGSFRRTLLSLVRSAE